VAWCCRSLSRTDSVLLLLLLLASSRSDSCCCAACAFCSVVVGRSCATVSNVQRCGAMTTTSTGTSCGDSSGLLSSRLKPERACSGGGVEGGGIARCGGGWWQQVDCVPRTDRTSNSDVHAVARIMYRTVSSIQYKYKRQGGAIKCKRQGSPSDGSHPARVGWLLRTPALAALLRARRTGTRSHIPHFEGLRPMESGRGMVCQNEPSRVIYCRRTTTALVQYTNCCAHRSQSTTSYYVRFATCCGSCVCGWLLFLLLLL
jgi:hypothetical protein